MKSRVFFTPKLSIQKHPSTRIGQELFQGQLSKYFNGLMMTAHYDRMNKNSYPHRELISNRLSICSLHHFLKKSRYSTGSCRSQRFRIVPERPGPARTTDTEFIYLGSFAICNCFLHQLFKID